MDEDEEALPKEKSADEIQQGSDNAAEDLGLVLLETGVNALAKVNAAIEKIRTGTFGDCEQCMQKMPLVRLRAIPEAPNCIDCQRQFEQESAPTKPLPDGWWQKSDR